MKKKITIILIALLFCTNQISFATSSPIEIPQQEINENQEEDMFAPVDLDLSDYTLWNKKSKRFKLSAEKSDKSAKTTYVKNNNQVWSEDKLFLQNYYSNETNLRSLPSYGSLGSFVTRELDENTSVMIGQDSLTEINGDTVNFSLKNYSYYSSGARLDRQAKHVNYSIGAFTETDTLHQQIAGVITTKPKSILNSKGKFYVGAGVFSNLMNEVNKNTTGVLAQYKNDKISLGTQLSRTEYTQAGYNNLSTLHVLSTYRVNDNVLLKNRIVKDFEIDELQGEVGIVLNPMKETDRLKLEIALANYQSQNVITRQRLKFTTYFKF